MLFRLDQGLNPFFLKLTVKEKQQQLFLKKRTAAAIIFKEIDLQELQGQRKYNVVYCKGHRVVLVSRIRTNKWVHYRYLYLTNIGVLYYS